MANNDVILHEEIAESVIGCGLVLTTHHVLILEFPDKVLSSASLSEITAIRSTNKCCVLVRNYFFLNLYALPFI